MGKDPDQPGYEARHDPGDPRQVGSGKEFGASQVEDGETSTFEALTAEDAQSQLFDRLGDITERVRRHWDDHESQPA